MTSMDNRIDLTFRAAKASGKTLVAPFVTIGFPDVDTSDGIAAALAASGGDIIELGVPFSDPLAEGPTIQKTSFHALKQGVRVSTGLDVVRRLRKRGVDVPLIPMGYYNPYLSYGLEKFVRDAAEAGADGLIVPDLPTEEAGPLRGLCESQGLHLIPLLAPTSTDERIAEACKHARGFIYCVQVTGVTGARGALHEGVSGLVHRIRRYTDLPVMVGFGVSRREHIEELGRFADGAIVGSALMDTIGRAPQEGAVSAAREFMQGLRASGEEHGVTCVSPAGDHHFSPKAI